MHTVIWTIEPNEGTSRQDILLELEASKQDYAGANGLLTTIFGMAPDCTRVSEISVWTSESAANAYFTASWQTRLSRRWQAAPAQRQDWDTPIFMPRGAEVAA
jgi:hypothetical protein